jgi:MOSC domain-containing protein YiiM
MTSRGRSCKSANLRHAYPSGATMNILHIYISPQHIFEKGIAVGSRTVTEVDEVECVAGRGLCGDRYFDHDRDYIGQVTFFSQEVYERLCEQLQVTHREPSVFGRNVIVSGVDLNNLIGKEFEVQGIRFSGSEECSPCRWMEEAFAPGAMRALKDHGGLRARILTDGLLKRDA